VDGNDGAMSALRELDRTDPARFTGVANDDPNADRQGSQHL
jgi:hypothetical protein